MAGQETLIYIDENDQLDAGVSAKNFAKEDTKNRAYYNTLGAKLAKKFLASENVDISNIYNIHSIQKVLEELDIADIMLNNIHIDVRVVFNENYIFVPKSHFEYDILPDIYLVLLMSNDKKYMKFLGFFEPKLINKNNQNEEYYFIEKEKLSAPENLKEFIENYKGNTAQKLSASEIDESDVMILSLIDHDISEKDKKQLLKNLVKSAELRDRFIEFENFEMLSYRAEHSPDVVKQAGLPEFSLDKAAEATAAALQEYTYQLPDEPRKDEEIMNGFNNLERNLPDFTPDEADKTLDEYENSLADAALEELTIDTTSDEITDSPQETIPQNDTENTAVENTETVDLDSLAEVSDTTSDSEINENEIENLTVDLEELPTLDISSDHDTNDIQPETVNLEEIATVAPETKDSEEKAPETVNLDEIAPVQAEEHHESADVQPETLNFDDIEPVNQEEHSENLISEPSLELENLEDLTLDTEHIETVSDKDNIEPLNSTETEELHQEPEMLLDENMTADLTLDETITLDELQMESETKEPEVSAVSSPSTQAEQPEASNNTVNLDSIENLLNEDEKLHQPEPAEVVDEIPAITEEDKELDQMLALENLTEETADSDSAKQNEILDALDESDLNNEETPKAQDPDDISIDDLKDLGLSVEGLSTEEEPAGEANTGDLISEIDDLLGSEEETAANSDADSLDAKSANNDNKLEMLFNSGDMNQDGNSEDSELSDDDNFIDQQKVSAPEKGKKAIIVAAALVAVLAAAAGAGMFLKSKNDMNSGVLAQNPIENDNSNLPTPEAPAPGVTDNTDLMTNTPDGMPPAPSPAETQAPAAPATPAPAAAEQKPAKPDKTPAPKAKAPAEAKANSAQVQAPASKPAGTPTPYVSIKSLVWEVPDYLSYSDKVKKYLQTAGKSIRLTLSSDLLLATEYAYSNQVKVELKLKNNGAIENIQITKSSGSNQINDIVLRTVKDTLNVVKPASGEIPTDTFKLGLIINF